VQGTGAGASSPLFGEVVMESFALLVILLIGALCGYAAVMGMSE
jgi:hypothetical protein